jgi:hypothetical protein
MIWLVKFPLSQYATKAGPGERPLLPVGARVELFGRVGFRPPEPGKLSAVIPVALHFSAVDIILIDADCARQSAGIPTARVLRFVKGVLGSAKK